MKGLVSIVIPAYNAEPFVFKAITSVINQSYRNIEVIITDDCSTDNTYVILQTIKDDRIKLFRNEKNSGVSKTLNNCILKAKGDLIAVMHADDIALPERIESQVEYLRFNKELAIVGSHCDTIDETDNSLGLFSVYTDTYELLLETLLRKIPFLHPSVMFRREAVLKVGLYNSVYDGMEDHDMWLRLAAAGYKFGNVPKYLLKYRRHTTQISQNFTKIDTTVKCYNIFYDFIHSIGMNRSNEETLRFIKITERSYQTTSSEELKFFLEFFTEILSNQKFLSEPEKRIMKKRFLRTILRRRAKKKLRSYIDLYYLLKWI